VDQELNPEQIIINGETLQLQDFALDENIIVSGSRELEMMEVERVRSGKFISMNQ
jgi:hypothetical protein